ncbi:MAG: 3-oxoacid CoA-transferase, partial [Myxococcales bacterium]
MAGTRVQSLAEAVRAHVRPGMHLNFASTPSRSNAAVREVARAFRGHEPAFVLSSTGFHSTAHLLAMLGLGRRYVACFFGDNYPMPRPHPLYERLHREGKLEAWSLWSYVSALRAGALGQPFALTRSLVGSGLAADLAAHGAFRPLPLAHAPGRSSAVADPFASGPPSAPRAEAAPLGLVAALRPDITFVHGLLGDGRGNVVFSPPHSEGFWGALGATTGVIATVERIVDPSVCEAFPDSLKIPAHRLLAVCEAPYGAHPQPLYAAPRYGVPGYVDDFDHYEQWRAMALDPSAAAPFLEHVLA